MGATTKVCVECHGRTALGVGSKDSYLAEGAQSRVLKGKWDQQRALAFQKSSLQEGGHLWERGN